MYRHVDGVGVANQYLPMCGKHAAKVLVHTEHTTSTHSVTNVVEQQFQRQLNTVVAFAVFDMSCFVKEKHEQASVKSSSVLELRSVVAPSVIWQSLQALIPNEDKTLYFCFH